MPTPARVYFSYAWGKEAQVSIVETFYNALSGEKQQYKLYRDDMDIEYGGLISTYMEELGQGDLIVVFLSDRYLRSPYCMYELYEIARNSRFDKKAFAQRVLPIRLESLQLDKVQGLAGYFTYWEEEKKRWDTFMRQRMAQGNASPAQMDRYQKTQLIEQHLGELADWLQDINASSLDLLTEKAYARVRKAIDKRVGKRSTGENKLSKKQMSKGKVTGREMVYVARGMFVLGEKVECHLSDFEIGQYQVTQQLWAQVMRVNPARYKGSNLPVEQVSWYDCVEFCNKLSELEGLAPAYEIAKSQKDPRNTNEYDGLKWMMRIKEGASGYRLPTEAEWEYAAKGGKYARKTKYAGSGVLKEVGWFGQFSGNENSGHNWTETPGLRIPNELGLYDTPGNVWEWLWDWYGDRSDAPLKNSKGPDSGKCRVLRGGSWIDIEGACRVNYRLDGYPDYRRSYGGFRLAKTVL